MTSKIIKLFGVKGYVRISIKVGAACPHKHGDTQAKYMWIILLNIGNRLFKAKAVRNSPNMFTFEALSVKEITYLLTFPFLGIL